MTKRISMLRDSAAEGYGYVLGAVELKELLAEIDALHSEPNGDLPLGFVMVAQCASCEQKDLPGAVHSYKCAAYPGQYVRVQKR